MGNAQSTTTNIVNSVGMSVVNDFVTTNIATTQGSSTNINTFTVNIGVMESCPLTIGQDIRSSVTVLQQVTDNQTNALATNLSTALNNAVDSNSQMVNGLAAMTGGNNQSTSTNIKNTISESISNNINSTSINQVAAASFNKNALTLNIGVCQNSPIQANQGIVSNVIAQNILTKITNDIVNNSLIATASSNASSSTGMHNQGLNDLVDSIGKAISSIIGSFTGPYAAVVIACVIMLCLCCAGLVYFMMSPAGQQVATTAANTGANFAKSKM